VEALPDELTSEEILEFFTTDFLRETIFGSLTNARTPSSGFAASAWAKIVAGRFDKSGGALQRSGFEEVSAGNGINLYVDSIGSVAGFVETEP